MSTVCLVWVFFPKWWPQNISLLMVFSSFRIVQCVVCCKGSHQLSEKFEREATQNSIMDLWNVCPSFVEMMKSGNIFLLFSISRKKRVLLKFIWIVHCHYWCGGKCARLTNVPLFLWWCENICPDWSKKTTTKQHPNNNKLKIKKKPNPQQQQQNIKLPNKAKTNQQFTSEWSCSLSMKPCIHDGYICIQIRGKFDILVDCPWRVNHECKVLWILKGSLVSFLVLAGWKDLVLESTAGENKLKNSQEHTFLVFT